jgi:protoporphyrinogen oxidase
MKLAILGGGPAGLSAGKVLSDNKIKNTVFEMDEVVGGIARTIEHHGFRFDLGGHRFFTKKREIDIFVENLLPSELVEVNRSSKIYFRNIYFDYPLKPFNAIFGMGIKITFQILFTYTLEKLKLKKFEAVSLEDWVTREFGRKMFEIYFKSYTEKVWGIECNRIAAEWVAQRIKGVNMLSAIKNALWKGKKEAPASLMANFKYPRLGIAMISEKLAEQIKKENNVFLNSKIVGVNCQNDMIKSLEYLTKNGERNIFKADNFISSIPITELINILSPKPPSEVAEATKKLRYRDLIVVALMFDKERITLENWIYIPEPGIAFGRIHEPKNWSYEMAPADKSCLVFEYFCNEGDSIWTMEDEKLIDLTLKDFIKIDIAPGVINLVIDAKVVRVKKAYPMYEIGYHEPLSKIKDYLKKYQNLMLIGRGGTYKYNNIDHSIETGIKAAENILGANHDISKVGPDNEYLED